MKDSDYGWPENTVMPEAYFEETSAPYQYNVREKSTGKLLGYSDHKGWIDSDIDHKWLIPPLPVKEVKND